MLRPAGGNASAVLDGEIVALHAEGWACDGGLRHAAFVALRDDKPAKDVRRELSGKQPDV